MKRVPEPELMDDPAQALAYARADFEESHRRFVELCVERLRTLGGSLDDIRVADLGCGPGDITLRLARALPGAFIDAYDGAASMLHLARAELATAPELAPRIRFHLCHLPHSTLPATFFDVLVSNSLLHHLQDPQALWSAIRHAGRPGARVVVMDLKRPDDEATVQELVATYAAGESDILKRDFYNSLRAAYTPEEVERQLQRAGLQQFQCEIVGDRHLLVSGRLL